MTIFQFSHTYRINCINNNSGAISTLGQGLRLRLYVGALESLTFVTMPVHDKCKYPFKMVELASYLLILNRENAIFNNVLNIFGLTDVVQVLSL